MSLSEKCRSELKWWITSSASTYNVVYHGQPELTLSSDASTKGSGCSLGSVSTGRLWTDSEAKHYINYLELLTVYILSPQSVCQEKYR